MAVRDISANAWSPISSESQQWLRRHITRHAPSRTRATCKCSPYCTSSTKSGTILFSSWPGSSFEVVANKVFCSSCGYISHVCGNGQQWTLRNAAQTSAKCKSGRKPHTNISDTPVAHTSACKYIQTLQGPTEPLHSALRLCKSVVRCSWKHQQLWRSIHNATRFGY